MIRVGVADDHGIEPPDAPPPQRARHETLAGVVSRGRGSAGVDQRPPRSAASIRDLDERRRSLPDVDHDDALGDSRGQRGASSAASDRPERHDDEGRAQGAHARIAEAGPGEESRDERRDRDRRRRRHAQVSPRRQPLDEREHATTRADESKGGHGETGITCAEESREERRARRQS